MEVMSIELTNSRHVDKAGGSFPQSFNSAT